MAPEIPKEQWAQVIEKTGGPLQYKKIPVQTPGPDEVLVNVKYSGVCHTDLHALNGDWPLVSYFTPQCELRHQLTSMSSLQSCHSLVVTRVLVLSSREASLFRMSRYEDFHSLFPNFQIELTVTRLATMQVLNGSMAPA